MAYADYIYLKLLAAGEYPLSEMQSVAFGSEDFQRMAGAYNEMKPPRPAPIVMGHPENDAPAYGVVDELDVKNNTLMAVATIGSESFRQWWKKGEIARHAAQFFAPDNPKNPKPGSWFLKHVGFLGETPPIIRGLLTTDAEFMETLHGAGRVIEIGMRYGGRRSPEFAEHATFPKKPADVGQLAHVVIDKAARNGERIDIIEALKVVCPWYRF